MELHDILVPKREVEIPRSIEDDRSRVAVVDALCRKYGLVRTSRRRVPSLRTSYGTKSFTFFVSGTAAGMRAS